MTQEIDSRLVRFADWRAPPVRGSISRSMYGFRMNFGTFLKVHMCAICTLGVLSTGQFHFGQVCGKCSDFDPGLFDSRLLRFALSSRCDLIPACWAGWRSLLLLCKSAGPLKSVFECSRVFRVCFTVLEGVFECSGIFSSVQVHFPSVETRFWELKCDFEC